MNDKVHTARQDDLGPENRPAAFTFTLPALFYLMTVYGISLFFGESAVFFTTIALCGWGVGFSKMPKAGAIILWIIISMVLLGSLMPPLGTPRFHSQLTECQNRIRQLSLATLNYEGAHGHFPAAHINDENATPIHSWRVLVLPHLGYKALFVQYDFDEPWDGANNVKLLNQMPFEFQCPSHRHDGKTTYKLVTGPRTAFVEDQTSGFGDVEDGSSNTLMIVEDFANPVPWTKPDDLSIDDVVGIMERSNLVRRSACCAHEANSTFGKACIGTCASLLDGSTHLIYPMSNPEQIRPFCTIDDGQIIRFDQLESSRNTFRKPEASALQVIYLVLLLLPGWVLWRRRAAA